MDSYNAAMERSNHRNIISIFGRLKTKRRRRRRRKPMEGGFKPEQLTKTRAKRKETERKK